MNFFKPFFVMWGVSGILWVGSFLLTFFMAMEGVVDGIIRVLVRIYAVLSCITAVLTIPAMLAYPPDDLPSFVLFPLLVSFIFGIAAYAVGWDRRLHGDWVFQKWYLWGKRLLLTGLIGIGVELLIAIFVIAATQKPY